MTKLKSSRPRDRLSDLPESIIFRIFWLLPMRDVVRTTILSKHWENLWTTAPCLDFDYDEYIYDDPDKYRNFVNRALICWEGIRIQKFKIDFHLMAAEESSFDDLVVWVCFALRKKVQTLYLHNSCYATLYSVPRYLYSCSSLQELSLVNCRLEKSGNVQWNQLKVLTIDEVEMSDDVINQVLCGSPQLEVFILTLLDNSENLSIRSSSLKRLSICSCVGRELRIWTPNLETLRISGDPCTYLLRDVSSLAHVTLEFCSGDVVFIESFLHREALRQILPTVQHVEKVTLSSYCIKMLVDMKNKSLLPSSSNVKFLILNNCLVEYKQIVGVLEIFPELKMLVLNGDMKDDDCQRVAESPEFDANLRVAESPEFDANLPESFLLHLRTIEVTWSGVDHWIFPFIKIVLEHASKLEKMVIRVTPASKWLHERPLNIWPLTFLFLASQKLLRMPRSSPTAELDFCYC